MKKIVLITLISLLCLVSCAKDTKTVASLISDQQAAEFTTDMKSCDDKKYYILMGVNTKDNSSVAVINIFSDEGDFVYSFEAGNVENFRGACWESGNYNIWTLTGDNKLSCYRFSENTWSFDKNAKIPEYMLNK